MGTRNLTMVIENQKTKIAQYGQWDGYPSGQGATILEFLLIPQNLDKLKKGLKNVRFTDKADEKQMQDFCESIGAPDGWMTSEQARLFDEKYPYLSRNIGGEILKMVANSENEVLLQNREDFIKDNLFCEWHYIVNLDKNQLEVYDSGELIKAYSLDKLPDEETFIKECEGVEDED